MTSKNGTQEKKPFSGTIFHSLCGVICLVQSAKKSTELEASDWLFKNFNQSIGSFWSYFVTYFHLTA